MFTRTVRTPCTHTRVHTHGFAHTRPCPLCKQETADKTTCTVYTPALQSAPETLYSRGTLAGGVGWGGQVPDGGDSVSRALQAVPGMSVAVTTVGAPGVQWVGPGMLLSPPPSLHAHLPVADPHFGPASSLLPPLPTGPPHTQNNPLKRGHDSPQRRLAGRGPGASPGSQGSGSAGPETGAAVHTPPPGRHWTLWAGGPAGSPSPGRLETHTKAAGT